MMRHRLAFAAVMALVSVGTACTKSSDGGSPRSAGDGGNGGTNGASGSANGGRGGGAVCDWGSAETPAAEVQAPWDWTGVVGTGQSLAVGQNGTPVRSITQPYGNLQLSTGDLAWPIDPSDAALEMVPLIEPIGRRSTAYPSSWPTNIAGETIHSSMANQITSKVMDLADRDYVGVHGQFGENGQCMTFLKKGATEDGVNGRAFQATLIATEAITRLAAAEGKSYGVGAITIVHGECDAGNTGYEDDLVQLWTDYNSDLQAITGQTESIQMLVSQQNSINDRAASTRAQWQVGVDHPEDIVCVGPIYQYESSDGVHLTGDGYRKLGEKFGQVYFERVVLGRNWQPLQPIGVERQSDRVLSVKFHVPAPPLVWDTVLQAPHQSSSEWAAGKGFEVRAGSRRVTIASVAIVCDSVEITLDEDLPDAGVIVSYALYGEPEERTEPEDGMVRWGLLRDSDDTVGSTTETEQPNFAVAFELDVP
jgi:lysophospholipase L1-like esterase